MPEIPLTIDRVIELVQKADLVLVNDRRASYIGYKDEGDDTTPFIIACDDDGGPRVSFDMTTPDKVVAHYRHGAIIYIEMDRTYYIDLYKAMSC